MLYRINHTTTYTYTEPVTLCHNLLRLSPRNAPGQTCQHSQIMVTPLPGVLLHETDFFGNATIFFTIQEPHPQLSITSTHWVDVSPPSYPDPATTMAWDEVTPHLRQDHGAQALDAYQHVFASHYIKPGAQYLDYARPSFLPGRPLLEGVLDLTRRIHADFRYDPRATTVATPLADVLAQRRGVCQDFAHLEIACLRSLGLPARYVSGYLLTNPPPGQQRLVGADASHAWLSVWCPGAGWIDADPTNNQLLHDKHITLAWGRDYDDVSPVKGIILGGGKHSVRVAVDVTPGEEIQPA